MLPYSTILLKGQKKVKHAEVLEKKSTHLFWLTLSVKCCKVFMREEGEGSQEIIDSFMKVHTLFGKLFTSCV